MDIVERLREAYKTTQSGYPYYDVPQSIFAARKEIKKLRAELTEPKHECERLRAALQSIAANTCCDKCQEAALVAKAALGGEGEK